MKKSHLHKLITIISMFALLLVGVLAGPKVAQAAKYRTTVPTEFRYYWTEPSESYMTRYHFTKYGLQMVEWGKDNKKIIHKTTASMNKHTKGHKLPQLSILTKKSKQGMWVIRMNDDNETGYFKTHKFGDQYILQVHWQGMSGSMMFF